MELSTKVGICETLYRTENENEVFHKAQSLNLYSF